MMLTGKEIQAQVEAGRIEITPFDARRLNPNSYNVRLGSRLLFYESDVLDMKEVNPYYEVEIPERGMILRAGSFYLGSTVEAVFSRTYAPMLTGRSSTARLGLPIHLSAGFGDLGWRGAWTLELAPVVDVRIYPGVEIGQVYFFAVDGELSNYGEFVGSKYHNATEAQSSRFYQEFDKYRS